MNADRKQGSLKVTPTRCADIPAEIEDISPQWLSRALVAAYPDIAVSGVWAEPLHLGTASTWRLHLSHAAGAPQAPVTVCIKSDFGLPHKDHLAKTGLYRKEASVYLDIIPRTSARTPICLAAGHDEAGRGFMLMQDLAADGGGFCNPVSSLTVEQVKVGVAQLASLHAATWDAPLVNAPEWLHHACPLSKEDPFWNGIFARYDDLLKHPHAGAMPYRFRDPDIVKGAFNRLRGHDDKTARSLIHGDAHIGNAFVDGNGMPGMADFQCVQRGDVTHDLSMFIGSSLDIIVRRENERAILQHYLDCLTQLGISPPAFDQIWLGYRRHYVYAMFVWLSTTDNYQPALDLVTNVFRYGMAALDLDSLGALE